MIYQTSASPLRFMPAAWRLDRRAFDAGVVIGGVQRG